MQKLTFRKLSVSRPQYTVILFSAFWLAGLLFGLFFTPYAGDIYVSLMRSAPGCSVSIVGMTAGVLVPFLLAAFAAYCNKAGLLLLLCFCKAFLHSMCAGGISLAFGDAGWLLRILLLFSDLCAMPFFCWFCLRLLNHGAQYLKRDLILCILVSVAVCGLDYTVVSPFLAMLI